MLSFPAANAAGQVDGGKVRIELPVPKPGRKFSFGIALLVGNAPRERGFDCVRRTQHVTGLRLSGRAGRIVAENRCSGTAIHIVVVVRPGAVQINPADVFGRKTCESQCRLKGKDCALSVGAGRGNMVGIAVGSIADEFGVNFRTAPFGVFQFFQHENPRAFADDQPVAVRVVWARGFFQFAVAAAGGIKRVENIHFGRENSSPPPASIISVRPYLMAS